MIAAALIGLAAPAQADIRPDYGDYLKARAADADGDAADAAAAYARALDAAPGSEIIAVRAYRAALEAGDDALVDRALAVLDRSGVAPADGALLALGSAARSNDRRAADRAIDRIASGPLGFAAPILRAWQALDTKGDPFAPLASTADANPLFRRYAAENRALIEIATGRPDDGIAGLRALLGTDQAAVDARINGALLLAGTGKRDRAAALLAGNGPQLAQLRAAIGDGVRPGFAFGVSQLLARLAGDLSLGDPTPLSVALTRAALRAFPANDRARLILAQTLAKDGATRQALATIDAIDRTGPFAQAAQTAMIAVLASAGDDEQALLAAQALAGRADAGADDLQRYGDQLVSADRYADAAKAYDRAIERAGPGAPWLLYLQKGGALEQAGDWAAARPVLEQALALAPDQPVALNYLGYAALEHGDNPAKALALLERAHALKPDDPSITDSLGWAYFKHGDRARALPLLEQAAQGEPADVTINEHLGDAYWAAGRTFEARYAWRAAAIYAEGEEATRIAGKIAGDLPPRRSANR